MSVATVSASAPDTSGDQGLVRADSVVLAGTLYHVCALNITKFESTLRSWFLVGHCRNSEFHQKESPCSLSNVGVSLDRSHLSSASFDTRETSARHHRCYKCHQDTSETLAAIGATRDLRGISGHYGSIGRRRSSMSSSRTRILSRPLHRRPIPRAASHV